MNIDTSTSQGRDRKLASLYQARSEGKTLQFRNVHAEWVDVHIDDRVLFVHRIKPQTLKEAAKAYLKRSDECTLSDGHMSSFIAGAIWQTRQDQ